MVNLLRLSTFLLILIFYRYRSQLSSTVNFFIHKGQFETVTVGELREQLNNPLNNLAQRICRYTGHVPGLAPFWHQKRAEVTSIVRVDCPHAFATFSAADTHWLDFHRIIEERTARLLGIPIVHLETLPEREAVVRRNNNLQHYPQIASEFLYHRFNIFLEQVILKYPNMKVRDYWFRYEWQFRGSGHSHGFLWIENAPTLSKIQLEHAGDRLQLETYWNENRVQVDTPVKALYPAPIHPCRYNLPLTEDTDLDLSYLSNRVQKHTCGSYCLRRRRGQARNDTTLHCRFYFPAVPCSKTEICKNPDGRWYLNLYRTEADLDTNKYNPIYLQAWRANTDFQPVLSLHAVLNYIAKYATKAETASKDLRELLKTAAAKCDDMSSAQLLFKRMLFTFAVERDFSAQEASHILQGLPLVISSWKVITLNLSDIAAVPITDIHEQDEECQVPKGVLEKYIAREQELDYLSLDELLRLYYYRNGRWYPLNQSDTKSRVIRCFPDPPIDPSNPLFCRVSIFRYIPFMSLTYLAGLNREDVVNLDEIDWCLRFQYFLRQMPESIQLLCQQQPTRAGNLDDGHDSDLEVRNDRIDPELDTEDWMDIAGTLSPFTYYVEFRQVWILKI